MREVRRGRSKVQGGAGTGSGVAKGDGRRRGPPLSPPVCSTACLLPLPCTQRLLCSAAARHSLYEAREQVHPVDRGVQRQRLGQLDNVLDLQGGPGWGCSGLKGGKQRDRGTRGSSTLRPRCCCASAGSNTPAGPPPPFNPPPPPPLTCPPVSLSRPSSMCSPRTRPCREMRITYRRSKRCSRGAPPARGVSVGVPASSSNTEGAGGWATERGRGWATERGQHAAHQRVVGGLGAAHTASRGRLLLGKTAGGCVAGAGRQAIARPVRTAP